MTTTISTPSAAVLQQLTTFQSRKLEAKPGAKATTDISITAAGDQPVNLPLTAQTFSAPTGFTFDESVPFVTSAYYHGAGGQSNLPARIIADGKVLVVWGPIQLNVPGKGALLVYTLSLVADPTAQRGTYLDGTATLGLHGGTTFAGTIDPT
ncbi:hypothetical protein [Kitasatospora purpeofusca]|uniref:hypothetical protein n=1 Tax=Kitasatospora purpeofusca TaxID=67352 RepID=UPI00369B7B49